LYRRDFIKTAATGMTVIAVGNALPGCGSNRLLSKDAITEFGIQLYTLRDVLPADPKAIFKQLASFGFTLIESYEHDNLGMFWGMGNKDFKKMMDDLGLRIVGSHCKPGRDFESKAGAAAAIGMEYLVCPSLDNERTMNADECKKVADQFNNWGTVCRSKGMRFAYHNHENTFLPRGNGLIPQQYFLENTDPALVDFEMDIYWVVTAGQDPNTWLKKYPGRFKLSHVKDRKANVPLTQREAFSVLGQGMIDLPSILSVAKQNGMKYFFNEQDQTYNVPVMEAVKQNAEYLKKVLKSI
jgi:sugar phosphate isomerase/epimerase